MRAAQRYRSGGFLRHLPRPGVWIGRHLQAALGALGDLARKPLGSAMTILVISIALALPAGLFSLLQQVLQLSEGWGRTTAVSVFLDHQISDEDALALAVEVEGRDDVASVDLLTRDDALAEFRLYSGFGDVIDILEDNPLPPVLQVVVPDNADIEQTTTLVRHLEAMPGSALVEFDDQWLRRFRAMATTAQRAALVLGVSLGLAVLLIVGNTIRLEIQGRRSEIEITKLVGGTDAFIRRPFLYRGLWYGLIGGLIAWLLTGAALQALSGPVSELASLYGSPFRLSAWQPLSLAVLLGAASSLALAGAWSAVGRHLRAITPS